MRDQSLRVVSVLRDFKYVLTSEEPVNNCSEAKEAAGVDAVDGVALGVEVGVLFLAGGVGLGEAADVGVVVAGLEVVQAGGVLVVAGEAVGLGDRFGGLGEQADAAGAVGVDLAALPCGRSGSVTGPICQ
ncbi:hypothetical protein GCM10010358_79630 [Streptomyces minutiscleroticus]|uniref:Uncharacterized protein n=1 Tax=Streptomyces minutiscleroticus TaxID=68238 RepID=A0A918P2F2_9ACTN|nr:hypothetical protein GCM10010358_79630 [Streptomyces minutiscleroticus]